MISKETIYIEVDNKKKNTNTKKKKKLTRKQRQKRMLYTVIGEIICLFLLIGVAAVWSVVGKINFQNLTNTGINTDLSQETLDVLSNYTNIAIFGLDNRSSGNYSSGNSDVIMIASINNKTKEVKLVSVYRDTYLNVGDGKYNKANSAYNLGGVEKAVQMLNTNLDLNIGEYVCVDWRAVTEVVDMLGGVEIELTSAEIGPINTIIDDMNAIMKEDCAHITKAGKQRLNGIQATAYSRIRSTPGSDFRRTSRQRIVLEALLNKAKAADPAKLVQICNAVFDDVSTSLDIGTIMELLTYVPNVELKGSTGFPFYMTGKTVGKVSSTLVPVDFEKNVTDLHGFLFDREAYKPSKTVQMISDTIIDKSGVQKDDEYYDVSKYNDTIGQQGTNFK